MFNVLRLAQLLLVNTKQQLSSSSN